MRAFDYTGRPASRKSLAAMSRTSKTATRRRDPAPGWWNRPADPDEGRPGHARPADRRETPPSGAGGMRGPTDGLALGALTTLAEIERHPADPPALPGWPRRPAWRPRRSFGTWRRLAAICSNVPAAGTSAIRTCNAGSRGAPLPSPRWREPASRHLRQRAPASPSHPSDLASALLALDAAVRLRGPAGERTPLDDLYTLPTEEHRTETGSAGDELLSPCACPAARARSTYLRRWTARSGRSPWSASRRGRCSTAGRVAVARVILGGVATVPWRVRSWRCRALLRPAPVRLTPWDRRDAAEHDPGVR